MAGIKDTRKTAPSSWPLALRKTKKQNSKTRRANLKTSKTKSHKKKTLNTRSKSPLEFREVKGKTVEELKLYLNQDDTSISILFSDRTDMSFSLEPRVSVRADLSDWKTHNYRGIRRWPALLSATAYSE